MLSRSILAGIFVGGASRRMGGKPKGLLRPPSGESSIVDRLLAMLKAEGVPFVLVGRHDAYGDEVQFVDDDPAGIGPIGGLHGLVKVANVDHVLALGCDMPFISKALLKKLVETKSDAAIVAPRRDAHWEPLFARYDVHAMKRELPMRILNAQHSLQGLLDAYAEPLTMTPAEAVLLDDWDEPSDIMEKPRSS